MDAKKIAVYHPNKIKPERSALVWIGRRAFRLKRIATEEEARAYVKKHLKARDFKLITELK